MVMTMPAAQCSDHAATDHMRRIIRPLDEVIDRQSKMLSRHGQWFSLRRKTDRSSKGDEPYPGTGHNGWGCFVPDLTRLAALPCGEARHR